MTGVKVRVRVERKTSEDVLNKLPVNWRVVVASSSKYNACGSKSDGDTEMMDVDRFGVPQLGVGYKYQEAHDGDMSSLRPVFH